MDLLLGADTHYLTDLHDEERKDLNPPQRFHGWYVFEANVVRSNEGEVELDETPKNRWHANVILPDPNEGTDALDHFYGKIASNAYWREREMPPAVEEFLKQVSQDLD